MERRGGKDVVIMRRQRARTTLFAYATVCGMVNYRYRLKEIEKNHEAYDSRGKVTTGLRVRKLL